MNQEIFADVQLILFDLDGTLYADTHHFDHYAQVTRAALPTDRQDAFWADYLAICEARHALQLGHFYDAATDRILIVRGGAVIGVKTWEGEPIALEPSSDEYAVPVVADHRRILNVGDLWWVVGAAAAHHGMSPETQSQCFLSTREWMMSEHYQIDPILGLADQLRRLAGRVTLAMATNSPQPDSEIILKKAGLDGIFARCIFRTNKPSGLIPALHSLMQDFQLQPAQLLSVGDNLANEIAPARALGLRTAFIDPHNLGEDSDADIRVTEMRQLLPYFEHLAHR